MEGGFRIRGVEAKGCKPLLTKDFNVTLPEA